MKIRVLKDFRDLKEDLDRKVGEEFIVNKERFEELNIKLQKFGKGPWVEEVKEK